MTNCQADQPRVEIDELVTINIPDNATMAALRSERVKPDQRLGDYRLVFFDKRSCFRTRRSYDYLGILLSRQTDR